MMNGIPPNPARHSAHHSGPPQLACPKRPPGPKSLSGPRRRVRTVVVFLCAPAENSASIDVGTKRKQERKRGSMSTVDNPHASTTGQEEEEGRYERLGPHVVPTDALVEIASYLRGDYASLSALERSAKPFRRVINDPLNGSILWQAITTVPVRDQDGNGNLIPCVRSVPVFDPNWGRDQGLVTHKQVCRRAFLLDKIREEQGRRSSFAILGGRVDNILMTELGMDQCREFLIQVANCFLPNSFFMRPVTFDEMAIVGLMELAQRNIIHYLQEVMLPKMVDNRDDANRRYDETITQIPGIYDHLLFVSWDGSMVGLGRERNVAVRRLAYRAGIPEVPAGSGGYQFIWKTICDILGQFFKKLIIYKDHHHPRDDYVLVTWEDVAETQDSAIDIYFRGENRLEYKKFYLGFEEFEDDGSVDLEYDSDEYDSDESSSDEDW